MRQAAGAAMSIRITRRNLSYQRYPSRRLSASSSQPPSAALSPIVDVGDSGAPASRIRNPVSPEGPHGREGLTYKPFNLGGGGVFLRDRGGYFYVVKAAWSKHPLFRY